MSCFLVQDQDPWLGSWPCVDSKDAVPKQKWAVVKYIPKPRGWPPGPVWDPKEAVLESEMSLYIQFSTDLDALAVLPDTKEAAFKQTLSCF